MVTGGAVAAEPGTPLPAAFTPDQVEAALERVRPVLRRDGGDIELVGIEGADVRVALRGACTSCPTSTATLQYWVEKTLREELAGFGELIAGEPEKPQNPRLAWWRKLVQLDT
jgi:Fe-S cluster biogenesis protein NfuA